MSTTRSGSGSIMLGIMISWELEYHSILVSWEYSIVPRELLETDNRIAIIHWVAMSQIGQGQHYKICSQRGGLGCKRGDEWKKAEEKRELCTIVPDRKSEISTQGASKSVNPSMANIRPKFCPRMSEWPENLIIGDQWELWNSTKNRILEENTAHLKYL